MPMRSQSQASEGEESWTVVNVKVGDGDAARLGLPTDAELDQAIRTFRAPQSSSPPRPRPALVPVPVVETSPSAALPTESKQARYRTRLRVAGRCLRCGGQPEPGLVVCATHRRYQQLRYAVRAHRPLVDAIYRELRARPELLGDEASPMFQAGAFVLLTMSGLRPKTAAIIARITEDERDQMLARLVENGIFRQGKWYGDWGNKETGDVEFVMTVLVAVGICVRIPAETEPEPSRVPRPTKADYARSHVRRPPSACRLCQRVGGQCRCHGGPSRSTAFRGQAGCSYCRRPKRRGHAATCRRAKVG